MTTEFYCFQCQKSLHVIEPVGRREECPHCHADVHVCRNCKDFDPRSYNECREPQSELVKEKDRSNFCDYFSPRKGKGDSSQEKDKLRAAAEALFKKS